MVTTLTIATLYHLYTTDFRYSTNTVNLYGVPAFYSTCIFCVSSLHTGNGVNSSTADNLADAASFCPGQTGSVHGRVL